MDITPEWIEDQLLLEKLAKDLRVARKRAGMSQDKTARNMGGKRASVSELENAVRDFRMSTLLKYARAIGVKIEINVISQDESPRLPTLPQPPPNHLVSTDSLHQNSSLHLQYRY